MVVEPGRYSEVSRSEDVGRTDGGGRADVVFIVVRLHVTLLVATGAFRPQLVLSSPDTVCLVKLRDNVDRLLDVLWNPSWCWAPAHLVGP